MDDDSIAREEDIPSIANDIGLEHSEILDGIASQYSIGKVKALIHQGAHLTIGECRLLLNAHYDGYRDCWSWVCKIHNEMGFNADAKLKQMAGGGSYK